MQTFEPLGNPYFSPIPTAQNVPLEQSECLSLLDVLLKEVGVQQPSYALHGKTTMSLDRTVLKSSVKDVFLLQYPSIPLVRPARSRLISTSRSYTEVYAAALIGSL
jgi:hypothetical protein